jgi:hypothetical protein
MPKRSRYNVSSIEGNSSFKDMCNVKVATSHFYKYKQNKLAKIMYLEGPNCRTTRELLRHGIPLKNCIPISCNELKFNFKPLFKPCYFNEVIREMQKRDFDNIETVWYDGNSTIFGNNKIKPKQDIILLLNRMCRDFTLFITFSVRSNHKREKYIDLLIDNPDDSDTEIEEEIPKRRKIKKKGFYMEEQIKIMKRTFKKCGYSYDTRNDYKPYTGSMAFYRVDLTYHAEISKYNSC